MNLAAFLKRSYILVLTAALLFAGIGVSANEAHDAAVEWKPHFPSMPLHQDFGGPFELTDHDNNPFTQNDLKGHFSLLYFGYTSCPDICAVALFTIAESIDEFQAPETLLTPYFVNLDPERDSLVDLAEYITNFHDSLVGLTGTAEQLRVAAGAYATRFKQVQASEDKHKTVHSGMIFLLDPFGEAIAMLPHDVPQDWLTATLREHVHNEPTSLPVEQKR